MRFTGAEMLHSEGKAQHANLIGLGKSLSNTCCIVIYGDHMACQFNTAAKQAV